MRSASLTLNCRLTPLIKPPILELLDGHGGQTIMFPRRVHYCPYLVAQFCMSIAPINGGGRSFWFRDPTGLLLEIYEAFDAPNPASTSIPGSSDEHTKLSAGDDAGIVIGVLAAVGLVIIIGFYVHHARRETVH